MNAHRSFPIRIRWPRFFLGALFMLLYLKAILLLQARDAAWSDWIVATLAFLPGAFLGFIRLRVFDPERPAQDRDETPDGNSSNMDH